MLIHLGQNEFISINNCELIVNLATIDEELKNKILKALPKLNSGEYRAAILTCGNKWLGSTISTDALAQRGVCRPFDQANYLKTKAVKKSAR